MYYSNTRLSPACFYRWRERRYPSLSEYPVDDLRCLSNWDDMHTDMALIVSSPTNDIPRTDSAIALTPAVVSQAWGQDSNVSRDPQAT